MKKDKEYTDHPDSTPLNECDNRDIFLLFGKIKYGGIEDIFEIKGIGSALANKTGIYFIGYNAKPVTTLGDLKALYKFATGNELAPRF